MAKSGSRDTRQNFWNVENSNTVLCQKAHWAELGKEPLWRAARRLTPESGSVGSGTVGTMLSNIESNIESDWGSQTFWFCASSRPVP